MEKLVAITVCVDYSDFLAFCIGNHSLFNDWYIVTSSKDVATQNLCSYYSGTSVHCIVTDAFYENGATFNKWAGYNVALEKAKRKYPKGAWVLFLDADIYLPPITGQVFKSYKFDKRMLYGVDRFNCYGSESWVKYLSQPGYVKEHWLMMLGTFEMGSRIVQYYGGEGENGMFQGWLPLGFFQLAHSSAFDWYHPQDSDKADRCDMTFAKLWKREHRVMLPDILPIHLESSSKSVKGANWGGRATPPFVPQKNYEKYEG